VIQYPEAHAGLIQNGDRFHLAFVVPDGLAAVSTSDLGITTDGTQETMLALDGREFYFLTADAQAPGAIFASIGKVSAGAVFFTMTEGDRLMENVTDVDYIFAVSTLAILAERYLTSWRLQAQAEVTSAKNGGKNADN